MYRFYYSNLSNCNSILIGADDSHKILNVLKLKIGDAIFIFDGNGIESKGIISNVYRGRVRVLPVGMYKRKEYSKISINLVILMSKNIYMDSIIRRSVELGVSSITLIYSNQVKNNLSEDSAIINRIARWKRIIISACCQSGQSKMPILNEPTILYDWLEMNNKLSTKSTDIILLPNSQYDINKIKINKNSRINLLVGNESGFSADELCIIKKYKFIELKLSDTILRIETAIITGVSFLLFKVM